MCVHLCIHVYYVCIMSIFMIISIIKRFRILSPTLTNGERGDSPVPNSLASRHRNSGWGTSGPCTAPSPSGSPPSWRCITCRPLRSTTKRGMVGGTISVDKHPEKCMVCAWFSSYRIPVILSCSALGSVLKATERKELLFPI